MGAWTEIADVTVASNSTNVVVNFDPAITKDDFIKVVMSLTTTSTNVVVAMFPNANTTNTNYHRQLLSGFGTGAGASRANENMFLVHNGVGGGSASIAYIKLSENDKYNYFSNSVGSTTSGDNTRVAYTYTTQSGGTDTTSITSLTFTASVTSAINTGSRIQIYRLDAEKVRDITVTSNSTQVDIPVTGSLDPAIGKDSEYLLVADISNPQGSGSLAYLTPNNLTTLTGYHSQDIRGVGSTANAGRLNSPSFNFLDANERAISYSHIKLSEIGAYTSQNYVIRNLGTSSVRLQNFFISSTSEAITSITKLNVFTDVSNAIGSGSRFILYKLK
jgi:hypothetical protein